MFRCVARARVCVSGCTHPPKLTAEQDQDGPHSFPRRAIVEMSATSGVRPVDAALLARLNIRHWMWLVTEGAPARLYDATARHTDQCEDCACGANPVKITGPRREVYMTGRRAQRLVLGWALKKPNPADLDAAGKPRPYSVAWAAWNAEAERCMTESARLIGLPEEIVSILRFSGGALIEPEVERTSLDSWMVPGSRRQPPHVDAMRRQLQAVFNVGLQPCESTHVYRGAYLASNRGAGGEYEDLESAAATLCQPRDVVEAQLAPVATLQPGEGACFMGDVIHAGAGNAEGEWRVVYFLTATWGDAEDYDTETQHTPWTLAVNVQRDIGRAQQLAFEYREYAPWGHFVSEEVQKRVEKYCQQRARLDAKWDFEALVF